MSAIKVVVCGDVEGNFKSLFKRIEKAHKNHGPFEYLFCVGKFFGSKTEDWEHIKEGRLKVPLTTYILGPTSPEDAKHYPNEAGGEIAPGVIYLGKRGFLNDSKGLNVAYLSGVAGNVSSKYQFSLKEVSFMVSSVKEAVQKVDILLTAPWPQGVTRFGGVVEGIDINQSGSELISYLAKELKPQYHFAGLERKHYERVPYRNHQILLETPVNTTRFIALAPVGSSNQKWMYAFQIQPLRSMKEMVTENLTTECPYTTGSREVASQEKPTQFFYDTKTYGSKRKKSAESESGSKHAKSKECWFCLANPEVEKQLLVSIGEHCYLTIAKGALVDDHVLIIPIQHFKCFVDLPEEVKKEVDEYKTALLKYFEDKGRNVVFFERNYASLHLQIQVVPIPKTTRKPVCDVLLDIAATKHIEFQEISKYSLEKVVPKKCQYFYFEASNRDVIDAKFLHIIEESKFPLQFGRLVLADKDVLNMSHRVDWKACQESKENETKMQEEFRTSFKRYDFTEVS